MAKRWFDPALALVVTTAGLVELLVRGDLAGSAREPVVMLLLGAPLAVRRSHPLAAACAVTAVLVANPDYSGSLPAASQVAAIVLAYSCGAHTSHRKGLVGVTALTAGLQVSAGFSEFPNIEIAFVTFGPWWIGNQLGHRRRLLAALAERTAELEAEQDAFARLSVRRERARIARELHDIVAHHLAVIVVQAGAARLAPTLESDEAAERFAAIRQSGDQALGEMARLVDVLHADKRDSAGALGKLRVLVDEAGAGGVEVRFSPLPLDVRLPAAVEDSAYHVVQEGLTNAIKHAPGAVVHVRLGIRGDDLDIEVRNGRGGSASSLAATGSGMGLIGMCERVESAGGSVLAGPDDGGGWRVHARLPLAVPTLIPTR